MSLLLIFSLMTSALQAYPSEWITSENHFDAALSVLQGKTFIFGTTNKFSSAIILRPQIHIAIIISLYTIKQTFRQQIAIQSAIYLHPGAPQHSCLWYIYRSLWNTIPPSQYFRAIISRCFIKLTYLFPKFQSKTAEHIKKIRSMLNTMNFVFK